MRTVSGRFWSKVKIGKYDDCWEWQAATNDVGFGTMRCKEINKNGHVYAHRISWIITNRRNVPKGKHVRHLCGNPSCVNPNHLFLGTYKDSVNRKIRREL